jgi:uncharacterized protein (TIGR00255 family)
MTGYARVRKSIDNTDVVVSVKSVNHRSLDLHFQTSSELDALEQDMRALLRRRIVRGHIEVRIVMSRTETASGVALNKALLRAYLEAFHEAGGQAGIEAEPDLNAALRVPGMLADAIESDLPTSLRENILSALEEALCGLNEFREREGREIVETMLRHNRTISQISGELAEIRSRAVPLF